MSNRNDYWAYLRPQNTDLMHHGVKGMKWRIRKDDGLTDQEVYRKNKNKRYSKGQSMTGTADVWAFGKMIVESMLGGGGDVF